MGVPSLFQDDDGTVMEDDDGTVMEDDDADGVTGVPLFEKEGFYKRVWECFAKLATKDNEAIGERQSLYAAIDDEWKAAKELTSKALDVGKRDIDEGLDFYNKSILHEKVITAHEMVTQYDSKLDLNVAKAAMVCFMEHQRHEELEVIIMEKVQLEKKKLQQMEAKKRIELQQMEA